jgi:N-acetylmuramoyl-L-alanine amidase
MKAICAHMVVWALICVSPATASTTYPFRSSQAELTVINTDRINNRTERELVCLARNIYHEARGQSEANQLGVAWVTRNRAELWGRTICEVVFEHARVNGRRIAQFSWTMHRHVRPMERDAWDQAQRLAWRVYRASGRDDITRGATHFHERSTRPVWSRAGRNHQQIGAHVFMRIPQYVEVAQAR